MTNYFDDFAQAAAEAEKRSEMVNFGKLTTTKNPPRYVWFEKDADGNFKDRHEIEAEQYRQLVTSKPNEVQMEICFNVDVKEFNPNLDWDFFVYVPIKAGKNSDWTKVVKPSLQKLLGKAKMQDFKGVLEYLEGKYVQVKSVPQLNSPDFNTIEFVRIYASRDECFEDWNARFGGTGQSQASQPVATSTGVPDGYTPETFQSVLPQLKAELAKGADPIKLAGDYMLTPVVIQNIKDGVYG